MNFATFVVVSIVGLLTIDCFADTLCHQNEIFEFGKAGQVRCSFQEDFFGLYWYDTQDLTQQPIIYREDEQIGGYGYESNRFDLTNDGSLIIINVTIEDERVFTVVILETPESQSLKHESIYVQVFVRPRFPYPVVEVCEKRQFCYKKLESYHVLKCIVEDARPTVHLKWLLMTVQQEVDVTTQSHYSYHGGLNTTTISMELQTEGTSFRLFACKADNNTIGLDSLPSVLIAEVLQMETNFAKTVNLNITAGSTASLACNGLDEMLFFVWKIISNGIDGDVIAYGYTTAHLVYSKYPYNANSDGFLVIASFSETNEGVYACFTSDGILELSSSFHLTSIGPPLNQQSTINSVTQTVVEENQEQRKLSIIAVPVVIVFIIVGVVVILLLRARRKKYGKRKCEKLKDMEEDKREESEEEDDVNESESVPLNAKNTNDCAIDRKDQTQMEASLQWSEGNNDYVIDKNDETQMKESSLTKEDKTTFVKMETGDTDKHGADDGEKKQDLTVIQKPNQLVYDDDQTVTDKGQSTINSLRFVENIPLRPEGVDTSIASYEIGQMFAKRKTKSIVLLGEDKYVRAKLIEEFSKQLGVKTNGDLRSEFTDSQFPPFQSVTLERNSANWIKIYTCNRNLTFHVTIIDIPGNCLDEAKQLLHTKIAQILLYLMTNSSVYKLKQLDAILLASSNNCTLQRLFGKDVQRNVYKLEGPFSMNFDYEGGINKIVDILKRRPPIKTKQTVEVLRQRNKLEQNILTIQKLSNSCAGSSKLKLARNVKAMVCTKCKTTCHFRCDDHSPFYCARMNPISVFFGCSICPNNCSPFRHEICDYRYTSSAEKYIVNAVEILQKKALQATALSVRCEGKRVQAIRECQSATTSGDDFGTVMDKIARI